MAPRLEALRLHLDGPVARLTLARPEAGNRIDAHTLSDLGTACEVIADVPDLALVVLTGDGANFCEGWDEGTRQAIANDRMATPDPFGCLAKLSMPVLAAVHGTVVGAGLELALACDIRISADDVRFSLPDVALGSLPVAGGSQRLPRIVGRSVATSMLLLGDELDGDAAYRAGLVSRVYPVKSLASETETLVQRIVANGPLALRYAKELVHNGLEVPLDQGLRYELDLSVILQTTRDRAEGVQAFLDKREPHFEGR
jgi:enoyl-CoA hydratase/carnithine racemase